MLVAGDGHASPENVNLLRLLFQTISNTESVQTFQMLGCCSGLLGIDSVIPVQLWAIVVGGFISSLFSILLNTLQSSTRLRDILIINKGRAKKYGWCGCMFRFCCRWCCGEVDYEEVTRVRNLKVQQDEEQVREHNRRELEVLSMPAGAKRRDAEKARKHTEQEIRRAEEGEDFLDALLHGVPASSPSSTFVAAARVAFEEEARYCEDEFYVRDSEPLTKLFFPSSIVAIKGLLFSSLSVLSMLWAFTEQASSFTITYNAFAVNLINSGVFSTMINFLTMIWVTSFNKSWGGLKSWGVYLGDQVGSLFMFMVVMVLPGPLLIMTLRRKCTGLQSWEMDKPNGCFAELLDGVGGILGDGVPRDIAQSSWVRTYVWAWTLVTLPVYVTHILPAAFLWFPVILGFIFTVPVPIFTLLHVYANLSWRWRGDNTHTQGRTSLTSQILEFLLRLGFVVTMNIMMVYGTTLMGNLQALAYSSPHDNLVGAGYLRAPFTELSYRSTGCTALKLEQSTREKVTWFLRFF